MNNEFYERVTTLRTQYTGGVKTVNEKKVDILAQIISVAFKHYETLPENFDLDFPGYVVFSTAFRTKEQIENVLSDLGYSNFSVSAGPFYEGNTRFHISIKN